MSGSRRAAAHLFELLAGPGGPGQRGYGVANAGRADAALAAIVAGGWSDAARVGQRAAELLGQEALGTQGAAPPAVVCAGGMLEPTPAERAAALEEYTEYSGGPLPDPRPPHAEQLKAVLMQEHAGLELLETPSATVATQASDAAALLGDRASDGATVVVVASPYQQTGLRLELAAAAPTARVICALSGGYAEESAWWESQVIPPIGAEGLDRRGPAGSCRLFLGPGFRLGARWTRLVETVKTRKKREKTGKKWARYGLKNVKEGS